ncbi:hypothetical protein ACFE04_002044 [Oxalis oulophora]
MLGSSKVGFSGSKHGGPTKLNRVHSKIGSNLVGKGQTSSSFQLVAPVVGKKRKVVLDGSNEVGKLNQSWGSNLLAVENDLRGWSREVFGNIPRSIKLKRERLTTLLSVVDQRAVADEIDGLERTKAMLECKLNPCSVQYGAG